LSRVTATWAKQDKHKSKLKRELYHCNNIPEATQFLTITTGFIEVWKLWQSGSPDVIGVLCRDLDKSAFDYIDALVTKEGVIRVVTDGNLQSVAKGVALAGHLAKLRFTRLINISAQIATTPSIVIRGLLDDG
jgi:hypothetical protein